MKHFFLFLVLFLATLPTAHAADIDYTSFKKIPVLHEGRVKPLGSFARIQLKEISGEDRIDGLTSIEWLAETLFDPVTEQRPTILIHDPEVIEQLGLPEKQKRFSLRELAPGLRNTKEQIIALIQKDEKNLTTAQRNLLTVHDKASALHNLHRSLSLVMPLGTVMPEKYAKTYKLDPKKPQTYLDLAPMSTALINDVKSVIKRKGDNPENYTEEEQKTSMLSFQIDQIRGDGANNILLRIMPPRWENERNESQDWYAPWAMILEGHGSPENSAYLTLWKNMAQAYRSYNIEAWNSLSAQAVDSTKSFASRAIEIELYYNQIEPFAVAMALYGLTLLFCLASFLYKSGHSKIRPAAFWPRTTLALAVLANSTGVIMRMVILERPPVSTLYESTIFVAAVCALFGLLIAHRQKDDIVTFCTAFLGLGLLAFAPTLVPRGESMEMLVAVLNTNFWLATHVVCITMGYGISILAAALAHLYMGLRAFKPDKALEKTMLGNTYKTALAALLLTTVGTILGGIWADQSWGRFWGWDPKENGALLIVLWLVWILHGRMSGHFKPLLFAASMAALNIIVALAWFGVNLLGTGLHSYGFTTGLATGLGAFCIVQILLIIGLWVGARQKEKIES